MIITVFKLLLSLHFVSADAVDHIEDGQIGKQANCILCGGRFLCGATSEILTINFFNGRATTSVKNFCHQKTLSYKNANVESLPWVSAEFKRYLDLQQIIESVVMKRSTSSITNDRIKNMDAATLKTRTNYRLENGISYEDLKYALKPKDLLSYKEEHLLLPVLSFEQFKIKKYGSTKNEYSTYLENLMAAPPEHLVSVAKDFVRIKPDSNESVTTNLRKKDARKKTAPDYYSQTSASSFFEKIQDHPNEFCEKMGYGSVIHANRESLKLIVQKYGGQSLIEQNYYYQNMYKSFSNLKVDSPIHCRTSLAQFLETHLLKLPNPAVKSNIKHVKAQNANIEDSTSRMPSSTSPKKSLRCRFNIDNYQEECD